MKNKTAASRKSSPSAKANLAASAVEVETTVVQRVYQSLKSMAVGYEFKPGERLNEGELSQLLGASRTPLREALNQLTAEGLLRFEPGRGFFSRNLDVQEIFSLFELRKALEIAAVRLALIRASQSDLDDLLAFLDRTGPDAGTRSIDELVELDETFHERLSMLSGNPEFVRVLKHINARIHFVRWIDMQRGDRPRTQDEHRQLLLALKAGDEQACVDALEKHIDRRIDQITAALREGFARIYMPQLADVSSGN